MSATKFTLYDVWRALLEHRIDDAYEMCSVQAKTDQGLPHEILAIVGGLKDPSLLGDVISSLGEREKDARGWAALFFGIARLSMGNGARSMQLFDVASEFEPARVAALVSLAGIYLMQDQKEMVVETIREGLSLSKDIGEFHVLKARLLVQDKNFEGAEAEMAIAREKGNYSPINFARFALDLLMVQDKQDDAIAAATALLKDGLDNVTSDEIAATGLRVLTTCGALDEANNYLDQALEDDKDNITLLMFRTEIAAMLGRFHIAAAAINRALKKDSDNIELLHRKATLVGQGFSTEHCLEAMEKVVELTKDMPPPNRAAYLATYGEIYFDDENNDKAIDAYEESLKIDEKCVPALLGLAQVLTTVGRLEEAQTTQDKVYEIAPVRAMQMMINADRIPEGDDEITRMQEMVANVGTPLQMRAALNLSLAKVYQKRDEHAKAIDFADKANEITRSLVSFDPVREAQHVDRIIARMSKEFFGSRKGYGSKCDMPIFVLGMPRSGTTLVEQIIGGHSAIFAGGELGIIPKMWRRLMAWEHRLGSAYRHIPDCVIELTADQSVKFADKVEGEYRELLPEGGQEKYITDKLPHNFKNVGMIKLLYPNAKIIYCRRSAGGIALSNYFTDYKARHGGMGFAYHKDWIGSEIANCQRIMDHWIDIFGDDIYVVDYEELVENPEPAVRDMFKYLNITFQKQVMDFSKLKRAVKTASVTQVRQPMYTSSKEKWMKYEKELAPVFEALEARKNEETPEPIALPEHEPGLFLKGMDLLQSGKSLEAEYVFQAVLDVYPRHAAAMHMLGAAYSNQGKILPAHKCMKRSIQLHPGNPTWYANFAIILDHMRQPEEAKEMRARGEKVKNRGGFVPDEEQHEAAVA